MILHDFRVANNKLSGPIPREVAALTSLIALWLHGNEFSGSLPEAICSLKPFLEDLRADCKEDESGFIELTCSCCTECCEPDGKSCRAE